MVKFLCTSAIFSLLILSCEVDSELNVKLCKGQYISSFNTSYYDSVTIYLPNAFTPGQDGINDWTPLESGNYDYKLSYTDYNNIVVTHSGIISLINNVNENANVSIDSCSECVFGDMIDSRFGLVTETNETSLPCN